MAKKISVLLFGITRDIVGQDSVSCPLPPGSRVIDLLETLKQQYPRLGDIRSLLVAVNSEYAEADTVLSSKDEIALIPPVSGG